MNSEANLLVNASITCDELAALTAKFKTEDKSETAYSHKGSILGIFEKLKDRLASVSFQAHAVNDINTSMLSTMGRISISNMVSVTWWIKSTIGTSLELPCLPSPMSHINSHCQIYLSPYAECRRKMGRTRVLCHEQLLAAKYKLYEF